MESGGNNGYGYGWKGDYMNASSDPFLSKIINKYGDKQVLFADKFLKLSASGKMKRRGLLITDAAMYIVNLEASLVKRRIALSAIEILCLSELSDNFLAVVIPDEYDCLMASTRKTEIVSVLAEAIKNKLGSELDVSFSNKFEFHAGSSLVKEVQFEEVDGGVRTKITRKPVL